MLLLVLCMFFHYDLHLCDNDKENFKAGFLDYSMTEFWWNGTPGIDQTDRITPQYNFMPTPYGHGKFVGNDGVVYDDQLISPPEPTASSEEAKTFTPFPNMTRASFPFSVEKHTVVGPSLPPRPPPMPSPWHINFPGLTPPPNFPSDYRYPTVFPTMHEPTEYSPSPTGPTPRRPLFTIPSLSRPKLTYPTLFATSTMFPPVDGFSEGRATTTPEPETSPWDLAAAYVKLWKEKLASYAATGTTPLDVMPKLRAIFNYDYTTYTHSSAPNLASDNKRSVNLALETVLEFNEKDKTSDIKFLDNVQNFITKVKTVIGKNSNVKTGFRRGFKLSAVGTFIGFIEEVANILKTYDNTTFTDFFEILHEEVRKYHYRGCKFHELTENSEIRKLIAAKLDLMRRTPAYVMKGNINTLSETLKNLKNDKNMKEIFDYINSLYRKDASGKFQKVLTELELHGKSNSQSKTRLGKIVKNGVRSILFDHYTNLNTNVRRDVKQKMETFWKQLNEHPPSLSNIPNSRQTSTNIMKEVKNSKPVSRKHTAKAEIKESDHKNMGTKRHSVKHDSKRKKYTRKETIEGPAKAQEKGKIVPSQHTDATVQQGTKIERQETSNSLSSNSLQFYHQPKENKRQNKAINSKKMSKKTVKNSRKYSEMIEAVNMTTRNPTHNTVANIWIEESTGRLPKEVLDKLSIKARGHNTTKVVSKHAPEHNKKYDKGRKSWHGKMYEPKHDTKRMPKHRSKYDSQSQSRQGPRQKTSENKKLNTDKSSKTFNLDQHRYKKSMEPMRVEINKTDRSSPDASKTRKKFLDVLDELNISEKSGKAIKPPRGTAAVTKLADPSKPKKVKYDAARRMNAPRQTSTDLEPRKQLSKKNKTLSWKSGTQFVESLEYLSLSSEGMTVEQMEIKNVKTPKYRSEQKVTSLEKDLYLIRKIKTLEKEIEEVKSRINNKAEVKLRELTENKEKRGLSKMKTESDDNNNPKIDKLETTGTVDNKTKLTNINKDVEEVASKYNDVKDNSENGKRNNADAVIVQQSTEPNKSKSKLSKAKPRPLANRFVIDSIPRQDELEITRTAYIKNDSAIDNTYVQNLVSKYKKVMEGFKKGKSKTNVNTDGQKVMENISDFVVTETAKTTKDVLIDSIEDKDSKTTVEGKKSETFFRSEINLIPNDFMETKEKAKVTRIADYQKHIIKKDNDSKNNENKFYIKEVKSRPKIKQITGLLNMTKTANNKKEILNKYVSVSDFKSIDKDKKPETILRSDVNLVNNHFKDINEKYINSKNNEIKGNVEKVNSRINVNTDVVKVRELQQSTAPNKVKRKLAKAVPRLLIESFTLPGVEPLKIPGDEDNTVFKINNTYFDHLDDYEKLMADFIKKKSKKHVNTNDLRDNKVENTYESKNNEGPIRKLVTISVKESEMMFRDLEQKKKKILKMTKKKSSKPFKVSELKTKVNNINQGMKPATSLKSNETPSEVQDRIEKTKVIETAGAKTATMEDDKKFNTKEKAVDNDYQTIAVTKEQEPIMQEDKKTEVTLNIGVVTPEAKHGGTEMMKYRANDDESKGTEAENREIESTSTSTKATETTTRAAMTAVITPTTLQLSTIKVFLPGATPSQSPFA